jgi:osmotically-inducible protein OsmY
MSALPILLLLLTAPSGSADEDRRLSARVTAALASCALQSGHEVRVVAHRGSVTLSGQVRTLDERECVAIAAERVEGVRFLEPRVVVRPSERVTDPELEERVRRSLRDDAGLEGPAPLAVRAAAGRVELLGEVRVPDDKYRAEAAARRVEGVLELRNSVRVNPQEGLRRMEVQLQELFRVRNIPVEGLRFFEAEGRVVIEGRGHDVVAREVVEEYVRDLPGGRLVANQLRVVLRPSLERAAAGEPAR